METESLKDFPFPEEAINAWVSDATSRGITNMIPKGAANFYLIF